MKETDFARKIVAYVQSLGWEVYQEVAIFSGGSRADILAVKGRLVWVIECKLSLTFEVIAQAHYWQRFANYASVAVPGTKKDSGGRQFARKVLRSFGVGLLEAGAKKWDLDIVEEIVAARLQRKAMTNYIFPRLCEELKTFAEAGNSQSKFFSPFQRTRQLIYKRLFEKGNMTLSELMSGIDHHYSNFTSAKGSTAQWIREKKFPGVSLEREGRQIKVVLNEAEAPSKRELLYL